MRKFIILTAFAIAALPVAASSQSQSQSGALSSLPCTGKAVTIRYGVIKTGKAALFKKAVADHQQWYATHGNGTTVQMVRVATRAPSGGLVYDDGAAMTIVTYDNKSQPAHDAAYDAFVKEYRDSEDVKEEHRGCLG